MVNESRRVKQEQRMNWSQEPDPQRLALLDALVRSNRAVWEGFSLDANLARVSALREALDGGCSLEQVASALGVHVSEVDAVAWTGRPDDAVSRLPA
jgi:hypothetical protein